jgi:hypothetical protein
MLNEKFPRYMKIRDFIQSCHVLMLLAISIVVRACGDTALQLYQLDEQESVSLSCSDSAVLKQNSRMLHFMIIAEVSKALGLQVASWDCIPSLDLSKVAEQLSVSFSNALVGEGNVVLQGTLLQPMAQKLVHICYLPVKIKMGYVAHKVAVEHGHCSLHFIVAAQQSLSQLNAQGLKFDLK